MKILPDILFFMEKSFHRIIPSFFQDNNSFERFNKHVNSGYECRSPNMPDDFKSCKGVVAAWGLGGEAFSFPSDAGYPVGEVSSRYDF